MNITIPGNNRKTDKEGEIKKKGGIEFPDVKVHLKVVFIILFYFKIMCCNYFKKKLFLDGVTEECELFLFIFKCNEIIVVTKSRNLDIAISQSLSSTL